MRKIINNLLYSLGNFCCFFSACGGTILITRNQMHKAGLYESLNFLPTSVIVPNDNNRNFDVESDEHTHLVRIPRLPSFQPSDSYCSVTM